MSGACVYPFRDVAAEPEPWCSVRPLRAIRSWTMSIREIEAAIMKLSPRDLAELAAWFADYHNREWEEQIERDLDAGRLDAFLAEAEAEYEAGRARPL